MKKTLLMTLAALGTMTATAYAGTVTVNGSTTVLPAMQQVTESFMAANPDVTVTISGSGSGNGIKALRDKMTDIAMSSRDLKSKEVQDFESHGMKTNRYTVAHDAIIPVVHNNNAVKGLTMAQLRDVFAGKIKNWKEVGGADRPIVVVGRDSSSGTFESWQELVMGKTRVSPVRSSSPPRVASFRRSLRTKTPSATSASATWTSRPSPSKSTARSPAWLPPRTAPGRSPATSTSSP